MRITKEQLQKIVKATLVKEGWPFAKAQPQQPAVDLRKMGSDTSAALAAVQNVAQSSGKGVFINSGNEPGPSIIKTIQAFCALAKQLPVEKTDDSIRELVSLLEGQILQQTKATTDNLQNVLNSPQAKKAQQGLKWLMDGTVKESKRTMRITKEQLRAMVKESIKKKLTNMKEDAAEAVAQGEAPNSGYIEQERMRQETNALALEFLEKLTEKLQVDPAALSPDALVNFKAIHKQLEFAVRKAASEMFHLRTVLNAAKGPEGAALTENVLKGSPGQGLSELSGLLDRLGPRLTRGLQGFMADADLEGAARFLKRTMPDELSPWSVDEVEEVLDMRTRPEGFEPEAAGPENWKLEEQDDGMNAPETGMNEGGAPEEEEDVAPMAGAKSEWQIAMKLATKAGLTIPASWAMDIIKNFKLKPETGRGDMTGEVSAVWEPTPGAGKLRLQKQFPNRWKIFKGEWESDPHWTGD